MGGLYAINKNDTLEEEEKKKKRVKIKNYLKDIGMVKNN